MEHKKFQVDQKLVQYIAGLAKISVNAEEAEALKVSMISVLDMIHSIDALQDTQSNYTDTDEVVTIESMSDDDVTDSNITSHLAEHFPHFIDGYFKVPTVVSQD